MKSTAIRLFLACILPAISMSATNASAAERSYVYLYGDPSTAAAADRTIVIHPQTRHVNVVGGDIVQFIVADKTFTWRFNVALTVSAFDLKEVAPPGVLNRSVMAYVSPDPRYFSIP